MSREDTSRHLLDCNDVLARLSEYRDGDLDEPSRLAVERHLAECERCARFGKEFMTVLEELRRHLLTQPEGAGLRDRIESVLATVAREAKREAASREPKK